jgi:hypothetical protein
VWGDGRERRYHQHRQRKGSAPHADLLTDHLVGQRQDRLPIVTPGPGRLEIADPNVVG